MQTNPQALLGRLVMLKNADRPRTGMIVKVADSGRTAMHANARYDGAVGTVSIQWDDDDSKAHTSVGLAELLNTPTRYEIV